jgi:chorismate synthase
LPELPSEEQVYSFPSRCPDPIVDRNIAELINDLRAQGDSIGGTVRCVATGLPPGLGEPVYGKLSAMLAWAMFSIHAVKGVDFGTGFEGLGMKGSEHNDPFEMSEGVVRTRTNHSGGIQGGISNGMPLSFRVLFKPASTISLPQESITLSGDTVRVQAQGRHDPCVVPRAVPVVLAMTALTLMDAWLLHQARYSIKTRHASG